jgi:hypothetical protein
MKLTKREMIIEKEAKRLGEKSRGNPKLLYVYKVVLEQRFILNP